MSAAKEFDPLDALTCVRTHMTLDDAENIVFFKTLLDVWRSKQSPSNIPRKADIQHGVFAALLGSNPAIRLCLEDNCRQRRVRCRTMQGSTCH